MANNSRFLILPWVQVRNLASHILGLSIQQVSDHWESVYGYPLYLLETFKELEIAKIRAQEVQNG